MAKPDMSNARFMFFFFLQVPSLALYIQNTYQEGIWTPKTYLKHQTSGGIRLDVHGLLFSLKNLQGIQLLVATFQGLNQAPMSILCGFYCLGFGAWRCGPGNSVRETAWKQLGIFWGGWKLMDYFACSCALSFETTSLHGKLPFFPQKMPVPKYKSWELLHDFFSRRWKIMGFVQSGSDIVTSSHD